MLPTNEQMAEWLLFAADKTNSRDLAEKVSIEWSNKMISARGLAFMSRFHLKFSVALMGRSSLDEQRQCMVHEFCHIVAYHKYRDAGHGRYWQMCMRQCGLVPHRCHKIDNTDLKRTVKRFEAKCSCMTHQVTHVVQKKVLNGAKYTCRKCRTTIVLTGAMQHV